MMGELAHAMVDRGTIQTDQTQLREGDGELDQKRIRHVFNIRDI
jgi:hypothetical protein